MLFVIQHENRLFEATAVSSRQKKTLFGHIALIMPVTLGWIAQPLHYNRLLMITFCVERYSIDQ